MNLLAWLSPGRWLLIGALLAALVLGYFAWADHIGDKREAAVTARYNAAIGAQKKEAAQKLADETAKVATAEKALNDFKNQQELKDATNQKTVAGLSARLLNATGPAGRLRDPDAAGCGRGGGGAQGADPASADDRANDPAQTGGLFSAGATQLLQRLTREADDINAAYISCRADAWSVRAADPISTLNAAAKFKAGIP